jgi:2-methylaconitate cis-trans-isomerase PrpF
MMVAPSPKEGVDVEYRFAQVGVEKPVVDWGGNCGNLSFAIGPYAVESGAASVESTDGRAGLVLENANTGTVVEQSLPVSADGTPRYDGDFKVHGVPGTAGRIRSRFRDPGGAVTGSVFPTGNRTDVLDVAGVGDIEVSLVDVSNPCVFARAADVGMTATETPAEIDADGALLDRLERVRSAAAERLGFVDDAAAATATSPGIPKMTVVGERSSYETVDGRTVEREEFDLLARIMSMQKAHHVYAVTGAMCTATAAAFPGTVPNEFVAPDAGDRVVIGHPKGTMAVGVGADVESEAVAHTEMDRTARKLMAGDLFYED